MADQPTTLLTQEMLDRRDVWSEPKLARPISLNDIIKWAIAVYWPEQPPRLYWDEDYAKTTRFGSIVAPQDFNPFAWPVDRPPTPKGPGERGRRRRRPARDERRADRQLRRPDAGPAT